MYTALKNAPIVGATRLARLLAVFLWADGFARATDALRIYQYAQRVSSFPNPAFNIYVNVFAGLLFFSIGTLLWLDSYAYRAYKEPK